MKELSIEDKAKRYDEAIKVAADIKVGTATYITDGTPAIDAIFPELKVSEDERIRKEILEYFVGKGSLMLPTKAVLNKWVAWLEKHNDYQMVLDNCRGVRFDMTQCVIDLRKAMQEK